MFQRLFAILVVLTTASAAAQTVTYTRPSKGKTLTVFTDWAMGQALMQQTSAVFDWTAFTAMQIRVDVTLNGVAVDPSTACNNVLRVTTSGATQPGATTFVQESDPAAQTDVERTGYTYTVGNLSPYVKLTVQNFPALGASQDCKATVTVVPFPVDQNFRNIGGVYSLTEAVKFNKLNPAIYGGIRLGPPSTFTGDYNPLSLTATNSVAFTRFDQNSAMFTTGGTIAPPTSITAPATVGLVEVEVFNVGDLATLGLDNYVYSTGVTIENTGTVPAYCALVSVPPLGLAIPPVSPTNYSFILKGSAVAGDGTGGSRTFASIVRPYSAIRCVTAAGSTTIAIQKF